VKNRLDATMKHASAGLRQSGWLVAAMLLSHLAACGEDTTSTSPAGDGSNDGSSMGEGDTTVATTPTYWQDVAPIVERRCVTCHQEGGIAPFALNQYESASPWARAAADAVQARVMPPWLMNEDGSCQSFDSSRYLSESEIQTIVAWAEGGAPEGAPGPAIVAPGTGPLEGAMAFQTPEFTPAPEGGAIAQFDEYRCFIVGDPVETGTFLRGYEILPSNAALVHHVLVMPVRPSAPSGDGRTNGEVMAELDAQSPDRLGWSCFGAAGDGVEIDGLPVTWAPGMGPVTYPGGVGVRVEPGTVWVAQIHYNMSREGTLGQSDSTEIRLQIADAAERPGFFDLPDRFLDTLFEGDPAVLAPGQRDVPFSFDVPIDQYLQGSGLTELQLYGVFPHMHELGRKLRVERIPAGATEPDCLGDVPRWDFNWQLFYFYQEPITLRAGDQVRVTCNFDTSSRTEPTLPGWGTQNEMCLAGLLLVP